MLPPAMSISFVLLLTVSLGFSTPLMAQAVLPTTTDLSKSRERGVNYLKASQTKEGYWTSPESLGVSGLITYSLLLSGVPTTDPSMERALAHLKKHIQPDGGIYFPKSQHSGYETAICLLALDVANKDGQYAETIQHAEKFLRKLQWDDTESTPRSDVKFGGAGYGRSGDRPDLSNTVFFLDALQAAGVKQDDPAVQNALVFLSRCQNLESEHNATPFAAKINDGGFYYTPAAGGSSPAGTTPEGGLRSYGSMTYAGLKSMVYAGLTPKDPRVKAASDWITKFYTLQENPGLGQQGVFYYYMMFAKTLRAMDIDNIADAKGVSHDWRKELIEQVITKQQDNGAWLNKNERWYEGNPDLATAYVLIALKHCEPAKEKLAK